jgi:glyoxylase-like metal-dependent hydrolase (beta-lactamase superfamily II)
MMKAKRLLGLALTMTASAVCAQDLDPSTGPPATLSYDVIQTSETSMHANITLVSGVTDAVLIDVPFSRADAFRVVARILDSGKTLKAILITHDHPDHFFGLDVLADEFPDAAILAAPIVVTDMTRSVPIKFDRWSDDLGTNAPHRAVVPAVLDGQSYLLEGHALQVMGPMQGDHVRSTVIWDEETRTLVAGDVIYNGMFVWLGEHTRDRYADWLGVIAGHTRPGLTDDNVGIEWTRNYIRFMGEAALQAHSAVELQDLIRAQFPEATDVYGCFLLCTSAQVATGEIEPWDE